MCFRCVSVTVHLVFRCLHPWEVCGWQTSQRAAGFPGWSEKRTRASARVTDRGFHFIHRVADRYEMGVLILGESLSIPGTCPWSCVTLLLVIPWPWVSWGTCKSCWVRMLYPGWACCAWGHRQHDTRLFSIVFLIMCTWIRRWHWTTSSYDLAIWLVNKEFKICSNQHDSTLYPSLKVLLCHIHGNGNILA